MTMAAKIHLFPCLQDNFGVLIHDPASGATAAIDAPEAAAVEKALTVAGSILAEILITHHHDGHTLGSQPPVAKYKCIVFAPKVEAAKIPMVDVAVREGVTVKVGALPAKVTETPGHTAGHISYWFHGEKAAFVGDTLFSIGCGRVIEGTMEQMWQSLRKLRDLPDDTRIYCGHEYTEANIKFAKTIEPDNTALQAREKEARAQRAAGKATVPTTLGAEKKENCFLRADVPEVAAALGMSGQPAARVFAEIRERKNKF